MQGSLTLSRGMLAVGVQAKTACVRFFDLDGHALKGGFSFRDPRSGRSMAAGLDMDEDRRIWVADTPAALVRCFSLLGREVGGIERSHESTPSRADVAGNLDAPVDIALLGDGQDPSLAVACGGERRHAVQLFDGKLAWRGSLSALGDAQRPFLSVRRIASLGRFLFVVESGRRCVQVFRGGEFLFLFHMARRNGERFEPSAIAPLADGRMVVACGGPASALLLVDGAGRLVRALAEEGPLDGQVLEPSDVVVESGADDAQTQVYAIDRDGIRVQVFTLGGRCLGAIPISPGLRLQRDASRNKGGR